MNSSERKTRECHVSILLHYVNVFSTRLGRPRSTSGSLTQPTLIHSHQQHTHNTTLPPSQRQRASTQATMSRPASAAAGTPVLSSPPPSESFFSDFDGTAGSVLDTTFGDGWEPPADASALNIVSWKLGVDAQVTDGVDKRGFNGELLISSASLHASYLDRAQPPDEEGQPIAREPQATPCPRSARPHSPQTVSDLSL
jgi:hypothetical protein